MDFYSFLNLRQILHDYTKKNILLRKIFGIKLKKKKKFCQIRQIMETEKKKYKCSFFNSETLISHGKFSKKNFCFCSYKTLTSAKNRPIEDFFGMNEKF